jgi:hypothetical protein
MARSYSRTVTEGGSDVFDFAAGQSCGELQVDEAEQEDAAAESEYSDHRGRLLGSAPTPERVKQLDYDVS